MPREPKGRLLAFADAIFGCDDHADDEPRRWRLRYVGMAALLAAIVVARRPDAVTNPQFWGEDGFLYFRQNLTLGFPRALENLYAGFPNLGQRLIAFAGGLVPFAEAPRVYTTATIAVTALGLASFTLPGFRHLVRSYPLRVLWCIAAASLPVEGGPVVQLGSVLSSPANLGWWVAVWLSLLSLIRLPRQPWRVALLALGGAVAIFTTPLAPVNAPLWLLRAWRGTRRSDRRELGFSLALVAALALCIAVTGTLGSNPGLPMSFLDAPRGYLMRYVALVPDRVAALVLAPGALAAVRAAGTGVVAGVALTVMTALVASSLAGRSTTILGLLAALYVFLATLLLTTLGRLFWALMPLPSFPPRYTVPAAAMLVLAVVIALDGLPRGLPRRLSAFGVTALLVWSWGPRFTASAFRDQHWPRYAALLDQKFRSGSTAPLAIPMNPPWTPLEFDVRKLAPERPVPANQIVASLASNETFRQTFVSVCDGLDGLVLRLAAEAPSSRGTVTLSLVDDERQAIVASVTMPVEQLLEKVPQPFYFSPIAGSTGRRYTIALQAVRSDPNASIHVLGAANDPYPDGHAIFPGAKPDDDASFAYSCARDRDRDKPLTGRAGLPSTAAMEVPGRRISNRLVPCRA